MNEARQKALIKPRLSGLAGRFGRFWHASPKLSGPPPFDDNYGWPNMCDAYYYGGSGWFNDEHGVPVTWDQINAVANLCGEVGVGLHMDYGCGGSSADTYDLEDAYEDYVRYDPDGWVVYRYDYDPVDWFNALKGQFNLNRPGPYRVEGHAIVADGWMEEWIGDDYYWYHMNYGWPDDAYDAWWALDELYLGGLWEEYSIAGVVPDVAIGSPLGPYYPGGPGFWRYFDQDTWGINSTFYAGQWLQILKSGFLLTSGGEPGHAIKFYGEPDLHTRFFLYGDPDGKSRILIQGGGMKIYSGAGMAIY